MLNNGWPWGVERYVRMMKLGKGMYCVELLSVWDLDKIIAGIGAGVHFEVKL